MCTLMAGVILILLGVTGLGTAVKFIPRPVVIGFTNGIGVLIASTQIRDFFGLQLADGPRRLSRTRESADRARRHGVGRRDRARDRDGRSPSLSLRKRLAADSRQHPGPARRFGGCPCRRASGRNHRHAFWRCAKRPAASSSFHDSGQT